MVAFWVEEKEVERGGGGLGEERGEGLRPWAAGWKEVARGGGGLGGERGPWLIWGAESPDLGGGG